MTDWTELELAWRLIAAAFLGGLIGLERGVRGRSAGLRTQMLVSSGAALAMIVSLNFAKVYGNASGAISIDPARVAYGVMGGIGFLGAGAIMRFGIGIRGLTTAASLWCTAAVGLAAGFGMYLEAAFASVLVLLILWGLRFLDHVLPHASSRELTLVTTGGAAEATEQLGQLLADEGFEATNTAVTHDANTDATRVTFRVILWKPTDLGRLLRIAAGAEGIHKVTLQ